MRHKQKCEVLADMGGYCVQPSCECGWIGKPTYLGKESAQEQYIEHLERITEGDEASANVSDSARKMTLDLIQSLPGNKRAAQAAFILAERLIRSEVELSKNQGART
jgi:hypothetical protein